MPRKITYEFVKGQFEKEGYVLLTAKYINAFQKLDYICLERHKHSITWNSWQQGRRCSYCVGQGKPAIEYIRSKFEEEEYILLSTEYVNNRQKLEYICPNGHKHSISWSDWGQGCRCPYCVGLGKLTIDFIKASFKKEGHILLSNEYRNCCQKLKYICPNGHYHSIAWTDWQQGHRCPTCAIINNSGKNHYNWKGGITCEPYCDAWADKEYKESIKERDNYECQNLSCWHKGGKAGELAIHHIDYVKKNCDPWNLITLCNSCNSRANKNREDWRKFYVNIMMGRGLING